ncbi:acyl-CoA thioesterase II [Rhodoligotrophos defluvii]|uniref:acyl-CoA thioesterase II n=1 Tax=Rhodoligotrophos defluvii TaxID=2561934 RepID=UPI0010C9FE79|nr:acyl-CoA thioesterase II [Rhodoligotrophos defluvii]
MPNAIAGLIRILDLEPLEQNLFRGISPKVGWQRVFGGQVIGQALVAAIRTVDPDRPAHSLHGYFMRPGDPKVPIIYEVHRDRDGASFSTRRVVAIQHGAPIFSMGCSFHREEAGLEHQVPMPNVPAPEDLPSEADMLKEYRHQIPDNMRQYFERERPIELRPVDFRHYLSPEPSSPEQFIWIKATAPLPDDRALHQCVLAYASDMTLLDTSLLPHGRSLFDPEMMLASLDHALWFHRPFRADEWLLYAQDSPSGVDGRGFNRGNIFTRDGALAASVAQEGLIRVRRPK